MGRSSRTQLHWVCVQNVKQGGNQGVCRAVFLVLVSCWLSIQLLETNELLETIHLVPFSESILTDQVPLVLPITLASIISSLFLPPFCTFKGPYGYTGHTQII